ncbi:hypothetical protein CHLNCDRAFT_56551 [Chlorella variabilis]|uniref:TauD/TfdA-like domain-containing protein n=1 Tax=Chlorella variabilis TaxID=554065 RepID=E1Z313_CHLVA|nr:hypothetical protein CHLNCDRAFT_56551 [Chlorella variabilis]EFN59759.1 hypothetical protein CHLNCDRAFT_56551 [Chlorella variabilis]|eukprot:XP_005851861.1 hypothetical protein CHLNCDRAFT_56551 [Chlorella variabilis]
MAAVQQPSSVHATGCEQLTQSLSCRMSARLARVSESAPMALGDSPFEEPAQRCLSAALSRGLSKGKAMVRVESEGLEGLKVPTGPVTLESGPQGCVRPYTIIDDPQAWLAADLAQRQSEWLLQLSQEDVAAVEERVAALQAAGVTLTALKRPTDFPLPAALEARLAAEKHNLLHGNGVLVIRGLPAQRWSEWQNLAAYLGLAAHIGYRTPWNKQGNLISHIKAAQGFKVAPGAKFVQGGSDGKSAQQGHATNLEFDWHTDAQADVLGLLCISQAKSGGVSGWSSALAVHNEMLRRGRGDLVACLAGPGWYRDRTKYQDVRPGDCPVWEMPVFHYHESRLSVHFHPGHTRACHKQWPELGPMTAEMEEAIDMFIEIASDPRFEFQTYLQPGDCCFMNNATLLHRRSAYEDGEAAHEKRHLVRVWLAVEDGRPRAPHLDFPRSYTVGYDRHTYQGLLCPNPELFHVQRSDHAGNHH